MLLLDAAKHWLAADAGVLGKGGRQAANILYSFAVLKVRHPVVLSLLSAACQMAHQFNAQEAANALWACATLHDENFLIDHLQWSPLLLAASSLSISFNPQNAANCMWATAKLKAPLCASVDAIFRAATRLIPRANPQEISICCWAAGVLQLPLDTDVTSLFLQASSRATDLIPQHLSNVLQAAGRLNLIYPSILFPLWLAAAGSCTSQTDQGIIAIIGAAAKSHLQTPQVLRPLLDTLSGRDFTSFQSIGLLSNFASLEIDPDPFLCSELISMSLHHPFIASTLANFLYSIAVLYLNISPYMFSLKQTITLLFSSCSSREAVTILWALSVLDNDEHFISSLIPSVSTSAFNSLDWAMFFQITQLISSSKIIHHPQLLRLQTTTSRSQTAVAETFARLNKNPKLEQSVGGQTVDIVITHLGSPVLVEFDGVRSRASPGGVGYPLT